MTPIGYPHLPSLQFFAIVSGTFWKKKVMELAAAILTLPFAEAFSPHIDMSRQPIERYSYYSYRIHMDLYA